MPGEAVGGGLEPALRGLDQAPRRLVVGDPPLERGGRGGQPGRPPLQPLQQLVQPWRRTLLQAAYPRAAVSATLPRMPLTNRPDSSPAKVLASSIDSLMAARTGVSRANAIS